MEADGPYVGIDVSKDQLDIAVRPDGDTCSMPNDASGITEVVQRLAQLHPKLVVLEATGGLQMPVAGALASAGLPLSMVNPRQVRDFARATGRLAKTDRLDAQVLAHFAEAVRPTPYPLPDAQAQELTALVITSTKSSPSSMESTSLKTCPPPKRSASRSYSQPAG